MQIHNLNRVLSRIGARELTIAEAEKVNAGCTTKVTTFVHGVGVDQRIDTC